MILLSTSKKIPGIKYKTNHPLTTLRIDSIQNGGKSVDTGGNKLNIECHVTLPHRVSYEIMYLSID